MAKRYRVGVIGRTGKGNYGHGLDTIWLEFPDRVEVVAVADENETGRNAAQKRLKCPAAYADFRVMLGKEKLDIVAVADRHLDQHKDMVVASAQAGCHIFLEKPIARTLAEADEMVAACERNQVRCAMAHQTRFTPRANRIRELLETGRIGDLVEMRGRGKEDQRGGGEDLMVLGTHVFDLMRFFAGDPQWCMARVEQDTEPAGPSAIRPGGEGMGLVQGNRLVAMYGFPRGVVGHFGSHKANHGAGARFGLQLFGTKGAIFVGTGGLPPAYLIEDPSWGFKGQSKWQPITSAGLGGKETQTDTSLNAGNKFIVNDLLDAIEKGREPVGSLKDGRWALEMILAVYASHRAGAQVRLPLTQRAHPLLTANARP